MTHLITLAPFAFGYLLSYLLRAVNAVIGPDLARELSLDAAQLGLLTSAYLLAFAAFQIPLGVLLDRYGPRLVQTALFALAALGCALFAIAESMLTLTLARALIGLGFAGALMSGFKAVVMTVSPPRRPLANALIMACGGLGLVLATKPTELAVAAWGWRPMFMGLAAVTLASAAVIFVAVRDRAMTAHSGSVADQIAGLGRVYGSAAFWRVAPVVMLTSGAHLGLQTLWAGPWFRDVAGYDRGEVATSLFLIGVAFLVGLLFAGALADWLVRRGVHLLTLMFCFIAASILAEIPLLLEWTGVALFAWFVLGMTGQASILCYPWLATHFGAELTGRAHTAMNLSIFVYGFATQYIVGLIIDLYPVAANGNYDPAGYQVSFLILILAQVGGLIWFLAGVRRLRELQPAA